jgi:hypothetical protein
MNRRIVTALLFIGTLACASSAQTFDAAREAEKASKQILPGAAKAIEENTDAKLVLEVDAASFGTDEKAWSNLYIIANRVVGAFNEVGRDQVGKDAIARDVKRVVISKLAETQTDAVELQDHTLHVRTNAGDKAMIVLQNIIVSALENALHTGHPVTP